MEHAACCDGQGTLGRLDEAQLTPTNRAVRCRGESGRLNTLTALPLNVLDLTRLSRLPTLFQKSFCASFGGKKQRTSLVLFAGLSQVLARDFLWRTAISFRHSGR